MYRRRLRLPSARSASVSSLAERQIRSVLPPSSRSSATSKPSAWRPTIDEAARYWERKRASEQKTAKKDRRHLARLGPKPSTADACPFNPQVLTPYSAEFQRSQLWLKQRFSEAGMKEASERAGDASSPGSGRPWPGVGVVLNRGSSTQLLLSNHQLSTPLRRGLLNRRVLVVCTANARSSSRVVRISLCELGWRNTMDPGAPSHMRWETPGASERMCEFSELRPGQCTNRFPGMRSVCRKVTLARQLRRMQLLCPAAYDFFPRTFCVPDELAELQVIGRDRRACDRRACG
jgi:hypothetical protein